MYICIYSICEEMFLVSNDFVYCDFKPTSVSNIAIFCITVYQMSILMNVCTVQKKVVIKTKVSFTFLYISDLFYYFVVHKKVKIQSHELISLHHILSSKKQHKITNNKTKNRIGKYSNNINSPLILSSPSPLALPRLNSSTKLITIHQLVSTIKKFK